MLMPQPNEVRCVNCKGMLFKAEGKKIIKMGNGGVMIFEAAGSITYKCKCDKINVFTPQEAVSRVAIAG